MRELVYLSDRKLQQFLPDRRPWWRRVQVEGQLKIPVLGHVAITRGGVGHRSARVG